MEKSFHAFSEKTDSLNTPVLQERVSRNVGVILRDMSARLDVREGRREGEESEGERLRNKGARGGVVCLCDGDTKLCVTRARMESCQEAFGVVVTATPCEGK